MNKETTEQVTPPELRNPNGKGGFGEHPENINYGGRMKNQERYGYWLDFFKNLTREEFKKYGTEHPEMSMAAFAAYSRIAKTIDELREFQEVANRTEGMPKQTVKQEFDDMVTEIKYTLKRGKDDTQSGDN